MGYAFTLPLFRHLGLIPVGAYVHYPTISTEMIHRVAYRQDGVTNSSAISSSWLLSHAKLLCVFVARQHASGLSNLT